MLPLLALLLRLGTAQGQQFLGALPVRCRRGISDLLATDTVLWRRSQEKSEEKRGQFCI